MAPLLLFLLLLPGKKPEVFNQLIVYVPAQESDFYQSLQATAFPIWEQLAEEAGVDIRLIDAQTEGAPAEIKQFPTLVFQHETGRNFYYGRYLDEGRIATWLRTGKRRTSDLQTDVKADLFTATSGRLTEAAIIKITEVSGSQPDEYDPEIFREKVMNQLDKGMKTLSRVDSISLLQTDRKVFFDLYPYRTSSGDWYISLAIFSPFDCIHPVFETTESPLAGTFEEAFSKAAVVLERAWASWKNTDVAGDAYRPIDESNSITSWQELGLGLSDSVRSQPGSIPASPIGWEPGRYQLSHETREKPEIVFQFMSPLDGYAGALDSIKGGIEWPSPPQLKGVTGSFEVPVRAVNMGNEGLNLKVWEKYLKEKRHPKLRLRLPPFSETREVSDSEPLRVSIPGSMTILGKDHPVTIKAEFSPVIAPSQRKALRVDLEFGLDISDWKIEGPDGPDPANHMMQFYGTMFLIHN